MPNSVKSVGYIKCHSLSSPRPVIRYVPLHGIYCPNERDKIRVVYDSSSDFQGRSVNKQLLSGKDLINQIVGLLSRFWEYDIAFMAETRSVFYQWMVSKAGRCCLKLLWWKDDNFDNRIIDFQMNVLDFCATFSLGYSNCALKETPIDHKMFVDYKFQKPCSEISLLTIF